MTMPLRPTSRVVWGWCLTYTAVAPPSARQRRRGEIRSHLWESEDAGLPPWAVLLAAVRGVLADLGWALTRGIPHVVRSFRTPTPYVALAPAFPIQAWIVSATTAGATAHLAEGIGAMGGGVMLAVAGLVWALSRSRS
jgi:hypothetical protein